MGVCSGSLRLNGWPIQLSLSSQVSPDGAAARDGRLQAGTRILEVNGQSLLGQSHADAVSALRGAGETLSLLLCDGFDPREAAALEVSVESGPFS